METRRRFAGLCAALWIASARAAAGAETDNLTYRYVPLEESSVKLNRMIDESLSLVLRKTNEKLRARGKGNPLAVGDTEAELLFAKTYVEVFIRRFGDRLLPSIETCIERNDCQGWPPFERIVLERGESIYGEAGYNRVAIAFLSPSFQLCGVRLGTDKLTHLFSHGFFYYNAGRIRGARLETERDVHRAAMADEQGLMGVHSTAVISAADAEATTAGYRMARDYFLGDDPVFARDPATGLLRKRRDVNVCSYVSENFDEVINPPRFTGGAKRVARLEAAIVERRAANERAEKTMTPSEKVALKEKIVARRLGPEHARLPLFYKISLVFKYIVAYLTVPKESRAGARYLVFPDFELEHRLPVVLMREPGPAG
jgi:hypothetical protein